MVRQKPCHMPCRTAGKAHSVPMKTRHHSFKPVTVEVARAKIEELGLAIPVEPFQHPDLRVCYATDAHVLMHAPASLPENVANPVVMCQAAYMRYTTHKVLHNSKYQGGQQAEQLMAERADDAAGDEDALLLEELTALLGSGRFKTLLKHLRVLFPSLRAAAREHQLSPMAAAHGQCCIVEGDESLQYDELVAEIEQRVTQLESVLDRCNSSLPHGSGGGLWYLVVTLCSSSLGSRGSELRATAHSNTSFSQPAATCIFGAEPYLDEQLKGEDSRVCKKVRASHLLTTQSEGEQRLATDSEHIKWASLPHHTLWEILKQLQWERKTSGAFRSVCKEWQEAHDSMVPSLRLKAPLLLPNRLQTKTGFTEVNELDLSSVCGDPSVSRLFESAMGSLTGLRRLNLAHNEIQRLDLTTSGPNLTGLTYLSLAHTNVGDKQLANFTHFLSSLTDLDLRGCTRVTLKPTYIPAYCHFLLTSLTALTRLDLSDTQVDDAGMNALAPLTALTRLDLNHTAVSDKGLDFLAPLAAHLSHLTLGGDGEYGDPEVIAVSSLTALTRLELLYYGNDEDFISEDGLEALSSLTDLVHLELNLYHLVELGESWGALSSLTTVSHLKLILSSFSDERANALACLTALTYLDLGDEYYARDDPYEFNVSDEGARALASLVRLTYLDLSGSQLSEQGLRSVCSLTALTHLDLTGVFTEHPIGAEVAGALCSLTALSKLIFSDTLMSEEAWIILKNSLNSSVQLIY